MRSNPISHVYSTTDPNPVPFTVAFPFSGTISSHFTTVGSRESEKQCTVLFSVSVNVNKASFFVYATYKCKIFKLLLFCGCHSCALIFINDHCTSFIIAC